MSDQPTQPPRFLEQVANAIRLRRMSYRTEQSYVDWAKRFILFHNKRHPKDMGAPEIEAFLTHLVNDLFIFHIPYDICYLSLWEECSNDQRLKLKRGALA